MTDRNFHVISCQRTFTRPNENQQGRLSQIIWLKCEGYAFWQYQIINMSYIMTQEMLSEKLLLLPSSTGMAVSAMKCSKIFLVSLIKVEFLINERTVLKSTFFKLANAVVQDDVSGI